MAMLLGMCACSAESAEKTAPARTFTDSLGRTVELPLTLERVAVSGTEAQIMLFALCPDQLAGVASAWDDAAKPYIEEKYLALPVLGRLYGSKGDMNVETLLASGAQAVIDIGEEKQGMAADLDALQKQTGLPFVHITAVLGSMGDAYRELGELMGLPDEAAALADYCDEVYARTADIAAEADKPRLLYVTGDRGLNVIANGAYHAEVIDLLSDNIAVVDAPSSKGTGNEADIEQILNWAPDVILYAPGSTYATAGEDPLLGEIPAIKNGRFYEVPEGPYNWMGFPPSVQRLLGMLWMAKLLYPDRADYDLYEEAKTFFSLFYHCTLTAEEYGSLVARSTGKAG